MKTKLTFIQCTLLLLLLSILNPQLSTFAQGTAFTYQGRLNNSGIPSNGTYDITFALFAVSSGGIPIAALVTNTATAVSNGLFTATIDFGGVFDGTARWLEIGVRTNTGGAFTTLTPRQHLTATPYAITAANLSGSLPATQLTGTIPATSIAGSYTSAITLNNPANIFDTSYLWLNPGPNADGLVWSNGQWSCPKDTGIGFPGGLWINSGHGTDFGNGTEWQLSANQWAIQTTDGNHIQVGGANGTLGMALTLESRGGSGSTYSPSHILNFKSRYGPGTAFALSGMWQDTWDRTNGGFTLHFFNVQAPATWTTLGPDVMKIDSDDGVEFDGHVRFPFTNNTAAIASTNYFVNFTNQTTVELDISNNLNLIETNLNIEKHFTNWVQIPKHLIIYPGLTNWTLTVPTNWIYTVPPGSPTNIPTTLTNSVIAFLDINYTLGSTTNRYYSLSYAPYKPFR